jgi:membrane associated rhomboid family serine protease
MTEDRLQRYAEESRITPWVGRLMVANAVVLLLLQTVFTAPAFVDALRFVPALVVRRPWTIVSYMFVHAGLLPLAVNMVLLFIFGPPVERRMGSRAFLTYYIYCGVVAATFGLGLTSFWPVHSMMGASGAVLGVALAFALAWPDAEITLFPLPLRMTARTLVVLLAGADLIFGLWIDDGIANVAHLGGLAGGYLFFRIQAIRSRRAQGVPKAVARRAVMAPIPVRQGTPGVEIRPALTHAELPEQYPAEEVDRVLDKISALGIQSLTSEERHFLDEVSKQKRKDLH